MRQLAEMILSLSLLFYFFLLLLSIVTYNSIYLWHYATGHETETRRIFEAVLRYLRLDIWRWQRNKKIRTIATGIISLSIFYSLTILISSFSNWWILVPYITCGIVIASQFLGAKLPIWCIVLLAVLWPFASGLLYIGTQTSIVIHNKAS